MMTNNNELNHNFFKKIENIISIIEATGELFISMHLIDLKENELIPIKSNERISKLSENCSSAQDIISYVMENLSEKNTLDSIKEFTTLSTLEERLDDKKMVSQLFCGKYLGWCNTMFIKLNDDKPLRYVLCVVQSVDKDIKRIDKLKKISKENTKLQAIVDGLMKEYTTVCSVNLLNEKVEFLRLSDRSKNVISNAKLPANYSNLINFYIYNGICFKDTSAAKEFFTLDNLKSTKENYNKSFIYRNDLGEYGEAKIIRTGNHYVLIGFSEKDKEINDMKEKLFTDSLTGVKNRKYYDEEVNNQQCKGLVIADVDLFKNVNDTYGHLIGDKVLIEVANTLKSCVRKTDDVIRYGGDEFVISFNDITPNVLQAILEKMRCSVEKIKIDEYPELRISMSFGAVYGSSIVEDMISSADEALYNSKENRNIVTTVHYVEGKVLKLARTSK